MKTTILSTLVIIFSIVACKKEKPDPAPDPTPTETKDTTRPVITFKGKAKDTTYLGSYTDPGVTATDNKDGDITTFIVVTYSTSTMNQGATYYFSPKGDYYINYDVRDAAGNRTTVKRSIHVVNAVDYMTGTYNAACTCTATDLSQTPTTTVTTNNYTATIMVSADINNAFGLSALNTGVKTLSVNATLAGTAIYFQPPPSGVSGGSIINKNSFQTETIDKGSGPDFHCVSIFTRQ